MAALSPIAQKFVLHWGEMGTRWGVNRTVAQIHALLYLSEKPLPAEEIAEVLGVARSNVSNSLHELQGWGIVRVVHVLGDRRDHFESLKDVWEMFQIILDQRKRREIDPTLAMLKECAAAANQAGQRDPQLAQRLSAMLEFFESGTGWYLQMRRLPFGAVQRMAKLGAKLPKLLGMG